MNTPSARDVEEPSDGLDAEDIKFLRSLRTSATPGPSSDGEAGERLGSIWHSLNSTEDAFRADARNGSKAMPPYLSGRNLCVRGRGGHKPLSLFCPEACGCHRGDRDCSLRCPEREPATPTCPAHQEAIWVREGRRPGHCPRLPRSQLLDVGVDHGGMMGEMP